MYSDIVDCYHWVYKHTLLCDHGHLNIRLLGELRIVRRTYTRRKTCAVNNVLCPHKCRAEIYNIKLIQHNTSRLQHDTRITRVWCKESTRRDIHLKVKKQIDFNHWMYDAKVTMTFAYSWRSAMNFSGFAFSNGSQILIESILGSEHHTKPQVGIWALSFWTSRHQFGPRHLKQPLNM